jgi:hypothetical protein
VDTLRKPPRNFAGERLTETKRQWSAEALYEVEKALR